MPSETWIPGDPIPSHVARRGHLGTYVRAQLFTFKDDHWAGCACESPAGWRQSADAMSVTFTPEP